ncbi:TWiK family of potassium channels protein 18-like isoform X2 [Dreissena polymorpha]|nr:TWiK family of potassium channels protein 18-like isoform X2 [Dreissena polymorpha]XP_052227303.1 TWiK family of potassium channels protein 18-like isoform X2 [Dreissena polymorpha]
MPVDSVNSSPEREMAWDSVGTTDTERTDEHVRSTEELDNSCLRKTKRYARKAYKGARSLVGLILLLLIYTCIGAGLFMAIESRNEKKYKQNITAIRNNMVDKLMQKYNTAQDVVTWKSQARVMLIEYEASIRDAIKNDVTSDSTVEVWTFWSGLFFSWTVYTTIGYGNIAPVTDFGRLLTIVYASIGIPLALLLLAELGKRFTVFLKYLWAFVRRFYYTGYCRRVRETLHQKYIVSEDAKHDAVNAEDENRVAVDGEDANRTAVPADKEARAKSVESVKNEESRSRSGSKVVYGYEVDDAFNLPIIVAIGILVVYIMLGAIMYTLWEEWTFIEAFYFVFVSLATIGFGDIFPAHQKFFIISSVYMFVGLSLVSMCINVAIEFFNVAAVRAKAKMEKAKKKIGHKVHQAGRNAKEKVHDMKTNIKDETQRLKQKTDEKLISLKTNITDETAKLKQKTDKTFTDLKTNIANETSKFKKKADQTFRKKSTDTSSPSKGSPSKSISTPDIQQDETDAVKVAKFDEIKTERSPEKTSQKL